MVSAKRKLKWGSGGVAPVGSRSKAPGQPLIDPFLDTTGQGRQRRGGGIPPMFWEGGYTRFHPPKNVRVGYQCLTSLILGRIKNVSTFKWPRNLVAQATVDLVIQFICLFANLFSSQ